MNFSSFRHALPKINVIFMACAPGIVVLWCCLPPPSSPFYHANLFMFPTIHLFPASPAIVSVFPASQVSASPFCIQNHSWQLVLAAIHICVVFPNKNIERIPLAVWICAFGAVWSFWSEGALSTMGLAISRPLSIFWISLCQVPTTIMPTYLVDLIHVFAVVFVAFRCGASVKTPYCLFLTAWLVAYSSHRDQHATLAVLLTKNRQLMLYQSPFGLLYAVGSRT